MKHPARVISLLVALSGVVALPQTPPAQTPPAALPVAVDLRQGLVAGNA